MKAEYDSVQRHFSVSPPASDSGPEYHDPFHDHKLNIPFGWITSSRARELVKYELAGEETKQFEALNYNAFRDYIKWETCMGFIRLALAFTVFIGSCVGFGFLAEHFARRHDWPCYASKILSVFIALIWPAVIVGTTFCDTSHYQRRNSNDPGDAPGYVRMGAVATVPVVFAASFLLTHVGIKLSQQRNRKER